jgi:AcrR family transcriptional regulator
MPYRSTEKTRAKKDAKRTAMMQAAVRVFAEKGYHSATVRDVVREASVAIGTFYFYFPDKETLFLHLYEETADFLLQSLQQAVNNRTTLHQQLSAAAQTYVNLALYDPAIVQLLLVGGVGAVASLINRRAKFREQMTNLWQRQLDSAMDKNMIPPQNTRRAAEILAGGVDEIVINLLALPNPELESKTVVQDITLLTLRMVAYTGRMSG